MVDPATNGSYPTTTQVTAYAHWSKAGNCYLVIGTRVNIHTWWEVAKAPGAYRMSRHTPIDAQMKLSSTARTHKQQGLMARQQPWTRVSRSVIILASLQGKTLHIHFRAMWVVLTLPVSAIVAAESPRLVVRYPMCIDMRISYVFCSKQYTCIYIYI